MLLHGVLGVSFVRRRERLRGEKMNAGREDFYGSQLGNVKRSFDALVVAISYAESIMQNCVREAAALRCNSNARKNRKTAASSCDVSV